MKQGLFLQKLSDALEQSKNKLVFPLKVGSAIFSNNYFWLHGRTAFKQDMNLSRELLRIRGVFCWSKLKQSFKAKKLRAIKFINVAYLQHKKVEK